MTAERAARALRVVAILIAAFTLTWFTAALPGLDLPGRTLMDLNDWPLDGGHDQLSRDARWLSAIGAGLLASFAAMLYFVVAPALVEGNATARRGALIAVIAWFVVDGVGSVTAGVPFNLVPNTVFLVMIALPLVLARLPAKV